MWKKCLYAYGCVASVSICKNLSMYMRKCVFVHERDIVCVYMCVKERKTDTHKCFSLSFSMYMFDSVRMCLCVSTMVREVIEDGDWITLFSFHLCHHIVKCQLHSRM